jgi:light-regulated signal transduction histidine kinase (bacteriophytochrome)
MVERDERQINSLIRLIEDMLDVSRIRTGKLSMAQPSTWANWCNLVENFAPRPRRWTRIELQRCEPLQGEWDEFRIEQVVANLLSNALRYGERKPVQVRVFEQDGLAWCRCRTRDRHQCSQPAAYFPAVRAGRRPAGQRRVGLGAVYFGTDRPGPWRAQVDSEEGKGATFTLPAAGNRTTKRPGAGNLCVSLGLMANCKHFKALT